VGNYFRPQTTLCLSNVFLATFENAMSKPRKLVSVGRMLPPLGVDFTKLFCKKQKVAGIWRSMKNLQFDFTNKDKG
jgi:hypothetical protein